MKKLFVSLVILALLSACEHAQAGSVAGILGGEQKFSSLPIGYNWDEYISAVQIFIAPVGWFQVVQEKHQYSRKRDGKLEAFAARKLRDAVGFVPDWIETGKFFGNESRMLYSFASPPPIPQAERKTMSYEWAIYAITDGIGGLLPMYSGKAEPATIATAPFSSEEARFHLTFRNGHWEVPEEVFGKVKFQFGWGIAYYIPEMSRGNLEVNLYGAGGRVSRFSTLEGIYDVDNPCKAAAILADLPGGWVIIPTEIAIPQNPWWNRAEIILLPSDERKVVFEHYYPPLPFDGRAVAWSDPPPKFFGLPPLRLDTVRAADGLEFYFSGVGAENALLEESKSPEGPWELSYARIAPASSPVSATGRKVLIPFSSLNGNRFFQLRAVESPEPLFPNSR